MLRRKHVYNFYFCLKTGDIHFQTFPYILRLVLIFCRSWHGLTTNTYMENMKFSHKDVANMIFGLFPFQKRICLTLNYLVFFVFSRKTPSCKCLTWQFFLGKRLFFFLSSVFSIWAVLELSSWYSDSWKYINCLLFTFEWFLTLFICIGMHFECVYVSNDSYLFVASRFMLYIDRKNIQNNANKWCKFVLFVWTVG